MLVVDMGPRSGVVERLSWCERSCEVFRWVAATSALSVGIARCVAPLLCSGFGHVYDWLVGVSCPWALGFGGCFVCEGGVIWSTASVAVFLLNVAEGLSSVGNALEARNSFHIASISVPCCLSGELSLSGYDFVKEFLLIAP